MRDSIHKYFQIGTIQWIDVYKRQIRKDAEENI